MLKSDPLRQIIVLLFIRVLLDQWPVTATQTSNTIRHRHSTSNTIRLALSKSRTTLVFVHLPPAHCYSTLPKKNPSDAPMALISSHSTQTLLKFNHLKLTLKMVIVCIYTPSVATLFRSADMFPTCDRLVGLVVKASASREEDPGFESRLRRDFSGVESYQWLKNWHSSGYPARRLAV